MHLALGVFDGVHIGHQAVVARAVDAAKREGGLAGLLTFDPHPIRVIAPGKAPAALLETLGHKARIIGSLGADLFVSLHFDLRMAAMEAGEFLDLLMAAPVRTVAVGEDWRFGRGRQGDVAFLRERSVRDNFRLEAVPPVMLDGERMSSTRIRQAIRDGNLADAERMLGRPHVVCGKVVEGRKLGRTLGFPTANLVAGEVQLPPDGVWVARVRLPDGRIQPAVANLGLRPTVDGGARVLEAHLFDFSESLYGLELEVEFVEFLRGEQKFPSVEALRQQIDRDAGRARSRLGLSGWMGEAE